MKRDFLEKLQTLGYKVPRIIPEDKALIRECFYAVRSDDSTEDTKESSRAGKFTTELFVPAEKLRESIDRVKESADNYFIQEMVDADFSCVALLSGKKLTLVLNNGLCYAITSGKVTGTIYEINLDPDALYKKRGKQKKALVFEENEMKWIDFKAALFTEEDILKIINLIKDIQEKIDIQDLNFEISVKDQEIYILQCRPLIT